jgi:hypothetical protein
MNVHYGSWPSTNRAQTGDGTTIGGRNLGVGIGRRAAELGVRIRAEVAVEPTGNHYAITCGLHCHPGMGRTVLDFSYLRHSDGLIGRLLRTLGALRMSRQLTLSPSAVTTGNGPLVSMENSKPSGSAGCGSAVCRASVKG